MSCSKLIHIILILSVRIYLCDQSQEANNVFNYKSDGGARPIPNHLLCQNESQINKRDLWNITVVNLTLFTNNSIDIRNIANPAIPSGYVDEEHEAVSPVCSTVTSKRCSSTSTTASQAFKTDVTTCVVMTNETTVCQKDMSYVRNVSTPTINCLNQLLRENYIYLKHNTTDSNVLFTPKIKIKKLNKEICHKKPHKKHSSYGNHSHPVTFKECKTKHHTTKAAGCSAKKNLKYAHRSTNSSSVSAVNYNKHENNSHHRYLTEVKTDKPTFSSYAMFRGRNSFNNKHERKYIDFTHENNLTTVRPFVRKLFNNTENNISSDTADKMVTHKSGTMYPANNSVMPLNYSKYRLYEIKDRDFLKFLNKLPLIHKEKGKSFISRQQNYGSMNQYPQHENSNLWYETNKKDEKPEIWAHGRGKYFCDQFNKMHNRIHNFGSQRDEESAVGADRDNSNSVPNFENNKRYNLMLKDYFAKPTTKLYWNIPFNLKEPNYDSDNNDFIKISVEDKNFDVHKTASYDDNNKEYDEND